MTSLWLVANSNSGSTGEGRIEEVRDHIAACGIEMIRFVDLTSENLPVMDDAPDIIASLGGDGTANAVIGRYCEAPDSAILILPGGTMNLLAARLHGEANVEEIVEKAARSPRIITLPRIEGPDFTSLVGVIAGPATRWGEVRENIREGDLPTLIDSIPAALEETFEGERVRVKGQDEDHAALFIDPQQEGLRVHAIHTESLGDLALHGWAWLKRDFLGGPTGMLMEGRTAVLEQDGGEIAMLADGERRSASSPAELRWGLCPARFITTLKD